MLLQDCIRTLAGGLLDRSLTSSEMSSDPAMQPSSTGNPSTNVSCQLSSEELEKLVSFGKTMLEMMNKKKEEEEEEEKPEEFLHENATVLETIKWRVLHNNITELYLGNHVTPDDVDNVVNTTTLLNALILTIPFGFMSSASPDFWDALDVVVVECHSQHVSYDTAFNFFANSFNTVIISCLSTIIMSVFYYLLKPKRPKRFEIWWKQAKYVVLLILIGSCTAVWSLISISVWMFGWYIVPWTRYCTYVYGQEGIMIGIIVGCSGVSFLLML